MFLGYIFGSKNTLNSIGEHYSSFLMKYSKARQILMNCFSDKIKYHLDIC